MRMLFFAAFIGCTAAPSDLPPAQTIALEEGQSTLTITVDRVKVGKGPLFCELFNTGEGFPGPSPIIGGSVRLTAESASPECSFSRLPAGGYAVSVIQDENDNGKLDANAFGVPTEGYGVSNNVIPATTAPRWDDSQVSVDGQAALQITVRLNN